MKLRKVDPCELHVGDVVSAVEGGPKGRVTVAPSVVNYGWVTVDYHDKNRREYEQGNGMMQYKTGADKLYLHERARDADAVASNERWRAEADRVEARNRALRDVSRLLTGVAVDIEARNYGLALKALEGLQRSLNDENRTSLIVEKHEEMLRRLRG